MPEDNSEFWILTFLGILSIPAVGMMIWQYKTHGLHGDPTRRKGAPKDRRQSICCPYCQFQPAAPIAALGQNITCQQCGGTYHAPGGMLRRILWLFVSIAFAMCVYWIVNLLLTASGM